MRPLHALLAFAMVCIQPVLLSIAPAQAQTSSVAQLAFSPPLDRPLQLRITARETIGGQTAPEQVTIEVLRFRKAEVGFVLTWHPLGGEAFPIEADLDALGTPLRVRDWPRVKATLIASANAYIERSAASGKYPTPELKEAVRRGLVGTYADLAAEDAPRILMPNALAILGWGGAELSAGASTTDTETLPSPYGGGLTISGQKQLTVESVDADVVQVRQSVTMDPASLRAAIRAMAERGYEALPPEQAKAKRAAVARQMDTMDIRSQSLFTIARATGLVQQITDERTVVMDSKTSLHYRRIELLP